MNILVTINQGYVLPLQVMLESLFQNNPDEHFVIFLIGEDLPAWAYDAIAAQCVSRGHILWEISVEPALLQGAPTPRYYPRAMYYRLLAAELLPDDLDRVLYLDPDILILNSLRPLYDLELGDNLFAAASHGDLVNVSKYVNMLRLSTYTAEGYFNSGVLLMNLPHMRNRVRKADIIRYANAYQDYLILPDQDILNGLYGTDIMMVDDSIWNYDARKYYKYLLVSAGEKDMAWVVDNVACLHFCGRNKPWREGYEGAFGALYKCYEQIMERSIREEAARQTGAG